MISKAADVETYIAETPIDRRGAIGKLRNLCRKTLKGYEESIDYGIPCYKKNGSFTSQKQYIALYMMKKRVDEFRSELGAVAEEFELHGCALLVIATALAG